VVLVVCWLALAVSAARTRCAGDDAAAAPPHVWGIELCLVGALTLYLLTPRSMQRPFYWHMINGRFVVGIALFAALSLRGPIAGWRRALLLPVVAATLVYSVALGGAFRQFNRHAAGFDEVVAQIPRGKMVLTMILRPMGDTTVNVSAFNQWPSYVQLRRGGYNFYNFAEGFPLRYRVQYAAPPWSHMEEFRWALHGAPYDYFLTFREGWQYSPMREPLADGKISLVTQAGEWRLYRKIAN
jgi:hypothetical protein